MLEMKKIDSNMSLQDLEESTALANRKLFDVEVAINAYKKKHRGNIKSLLGAMDLVDKKKKVAPSMKEELATQ